MARKIIEPEILPDDRHIVEAKHTIEYKAPVSVAAVDPEVPEYDANELGEEETTEEKPKRRRNSEREELRKILAKNNITSASPLKLTVERYLHSEAAAGGTWAETEFLTKYTCTQAHITSEDYLEVARKWGPGTYRFTLRMNHQIVTAWDKRLGVAVTQAPQQIQPNDSVSQSIEGQQAGAGGVPSMKEWMRMQREALREQCEMAKLLREAYGPSEQPQTQETTDPELAALRLIMKSPDVMKKIGTGLAQTVLGAKNDEDPWAEVAKEIIRSGQGPEIIATVIREFMAPLTNLWGGHNGTTQMAATQVQTQAVQGVESQQINQLPGGQIGAQGAEGDPRNQAQNVAGQLPEDYLLTAVLSQCERKVPPTIAVERILEIADHFNALPGQSVEGYLHLFCSLEPTAALEYAKTLGADGARIAALPHALDWTSELQQLLKTRLDENTE